MSRAPRSPHGIILPRRAAALVEDALADTRVVLVNGARQAGKSTLVSLIGEDRGAVWFSLDDPPTRRAAAADSSTRTCRT